MCAEEKTEKLIYDAVEYIVRELKRSDNAEFVTWNSLGPTGQPYLLEYNGRKHIYAYTSVATVTLSTADGLSVPLTQNTWINISFPESTRFTSSAAGIIIFKRTDEDVP